MKLLLFYRIIPLATLGLIWGCSATEPSAAANSEPPVIAKAEIRYLADLRELSADLRFYRGDSLAGSTSYSPPEGSVAFLGSAMTEKSLGEFTRWRSRMRADFPEKLRFTFPLNADAPLEKTTVNLEFDKIVADSIPTVISKSQRQRFYAGREPLKMGESIVVFFEPTDRSAKARRIIVAGPGKSNYIALPTEAMTQLEAGPHSAYLVKQAIRRDTLDGLVSAVTFQYHTRPVDVSIVE
ncbi:hypothetical protein CEQ90_04865 [Lewinellaceae bacterium SD302]|nr:hypothetical protein CEQ90_04865 [Lewinellaceae bacterium SD302]